MSQGNIWSRPASSALTTGLNWSVREEERILSSTTWGKWAAMSVAWPQGPWVDPRPTVFNFLHPPKDEDLRFYGHLSICAGQVGEVSVCWELWGVMFFFVWWEIVVGNDEAPRSMGNTDGRVDQCQSKELREDRRETGRQTYGKGGRTVNAGGGGK